MVEPLLRVESLKKYFPVTKGIVIERTVGWIKAVDGIDFVINPNETFGLVGESGCGKTTTGMLILRLQTPTDGTIWLGKNNINKLNGQQVKEYHKSVQALFQDPYSSLSPRMLVRSIVGEPLKVNTNLSKNEIKDKVSEALAQVGLNQDAVDLYPHEFSGGQRQRLALARAIVLRPKLVVLDEPVSALDVSIRASVMNLLKDIQQNLGMAYLLIAHNLATMRFMCDWVGIMYLGKIVELAASEELFTHPLHPYTHALFSAALPSDPDVKREGIILKGEVPSPIDVPPGCRFHSRCHSALKNCSEEEPALKQVGPEHFVACGRFS